MSTVRIINLGLDPVEVGQPSGARASLGVNATGDFDAPFVVMPEADAAAFFNPQSPAPSNPEGANVPVVLTASIVDGLADNNAISNTPEITLVSGGGGEFAGAGAGGSFDAAPSSSDSSSSSSSDSGSSSSSD